MALSLHCTHLNICFYQLYPRRRTLRHLLARHSRTDLGLAGRNFCTHWRHCRHRRRTLRPPLSTHCRKTLDFQHSLRGTRQYCLYYRHRIVLALPARNFRISDLYDLMCSRSCTDYFLFCRHHHTPLRPLSSRCRKNCHALCNYFYSHCRRFYPRRRTLRPFPSCRSRIDPHSRGNHCDMRSYDQYPRRRIVPDLRERHFCIQPRLEGCVCSHLCTRYHL